METLRPIGDQVLVRVLEPETKTKSGIVIPDPEAAAGLPRAIVLAIAPTVKAEGKEVKVGDRVVISNRVHGQRRVKIKTLSESDRLYVVQEHDIHFIEENEP